MVGVWCHSDNVYPRTICGNGHCAVKRSLENSRRSFYRRDTTFFPHLCACLGQQFADIAHTSVADSPPELAEVCGPYFVTAAALHFHLPGRNLNHSILPDDVRKSKYK